MTVSEQIIEVIDALCVKLGVAVDWTSENVIPYIETLCGKLINYEIGTSIAWMVIWSIVIIGSIVATKKLHPIFKRGIENQSSWDCGWEVGATFAIIGLVVINLMGVIVICGETMDIIKCLTFPEMYIFEYVQGVISAG